MRERLTIVTRKGQITVPAELRRAWGLKVGDKVAISDPDDATGAATLRPVRSVAELTFGALSTSQVAPTPRESRQEFIDAVVEREVGRQRRRGKLERDGSRKNVKMGAHG